MTKESLTTQPNQYLACSIRVQRKMLGLSIAELSEKTGVSTGAISMLENGKANDPSDEILTKLASGLGAEAENLIGLREKKCLFSDEELADQEQQLLLLFRSSSSKLRKAILDQAHFLSSLLQSEIATK